MPDRGLDPLDDDGRLIARWLRLADAWERRMERRYPGADFGPAVTDGLRKAAAGYDEGKGTFPAYLKSCLRNEQSGIIRLWRKRHHLRNRGLFILEHAGSIDPGYARVDMLDEYRPVREALDQLPPQSAAWLLRHAAGETMAEIGRSEGWSEAYVHAAISKARRRVRSILAA